MKIIDIIETISDNNAAVITLLKSNEFSFKEDFEDLCDRLDKYQIIVGYSTKPQNKTQKIIDYEKLLKENLDSYLADINALLTTNMFDLSLENDNELKLFLKLCNRYKKILIDKRNIVEL